MSEKKILFLDVDGTLIDYEAKLPLSAEKAVNMAVLMVVMWKTMAKCFFIKASAWKM